MTGDETARSNRENERLLREYRRREAEIPADRYAPWQPAEGFMLAGRRRLAAGMLRRAGVFPEADTPCLEVGYGRLGWLGVSASGKTPARRSMPAASRRRPASMNPSAGCHGA